MDVGEFSGSRLNTGLRLDYRLKPCLERPTQLNSTENVLNCNNSQTSWVELSRVVKSVQSARPNSTQPVELSWVRRCEQGFSLWARTSASHAVSAVAELLVLVTVVP